jgi:hypothetical protein
VIDKVLTVSTWILRAGFPRPAQAHRYMSSYSGIAPFVLIAQLSVAATPCDTVRRALTDAERRELAPAIAVQLETNSVDVREAYRYGEWRIVYVVTKDSDPPFLFYRGDPLQTNYVTYWSGGARRDEGPEIERWVLENAPGIPEPLAACFAYRVTQPRSR